MQTTLPNPLLMLDGQWMDGTLGYYLRAGGHSLLREDWQVFLDFADKHFAMSNP